MYKTSVSPILNLKVVRCLFTEGEHFVVCESHRTFGLAYRPIHNSKLVSLAFIRHALTEIVNIMYSYACNIRHRPIFDGGNTGNARYMLLLYYCDILKATLFCIFDGLHCPKPNIGHQPSSSSHFVTQVTEIALLIK